MTALAAERYPAPRLLTAVKRRFPVAANAMIWKGGMVGLSGAGAAAVAAALGAVAQKSVGVAVVSVSNVGGAAGAVTVDVELGVWLMNNSGADPVALGDIGATVYAQDDNTISKTGAPASGTPTQPIAGTLFNIDAATGAAWVKFS
jgi:hypothetical protein